MYGENYRGEEREYKFVPFRQDPGLHILDFLNQELAYGSDIDIGRSGKSSKVGERDRKLTRVGGRGAVYIYSNGGDSSTRQMGER